MSAKKAKRPRVVPAPMPAPPFTIFAMQDKPASDRHLRQPTPEQRALEAKMDAQRLAREQANWNKWYPEDPCTGSRRPPESVCGFCGGIQRSVHDQHRSCRRKAEVELQQQQPKDSTP